MDNNPINLNDVMGDMTSDGGYPVKHRVKKNENLEGIFTKYGVSVDHLIRKNNLVFS
ncbi:LysM peptidoglycan-binding domain-containing protein [Flavobacteriales bacterium]|nr:LysM peptidoglycan-binding domain-containing protein [Flavobacteriales bacterium]